MKLIISLQLLLSVFFASISVAWCPGYLVPRLDLSTQQYDEVSHIPGRLPLIIVSHPFVYLYNDPIGAGEPGLYYLSSYANLNNFTRAYLVSSPKNSYYIRDEDPSYIIGSGGGSFDFDFETNHVVIAGGNCWVCFSRQFRTVVNRLAVRLMRKDQIGGFRLTVFTDAVFDASHFRPFEIPVPDIPLLGDTIREIDRQYLNELILRIALRGLNYDDRIMEAPPEGFQLEDLYPIEIQLNGDRRHTLGDARNGQRKLTINFVARNLNEGWTEFLNRSFQIP